MISKLVKGLLCSLSSMMVFVVPVKTDSSTVVIRMASSV